MAPWAHNWDGLWPQTGAGIVGCDDYSKSKSDSKSTSSAQGSVGQVFVPLIHLLQEDKRDDCVRPQSEVVGGEALPEAEEAFRPDDAEEDVEGAAIFRLSLDDSHVLDSRFSNVHRHRCDGSDKTWKKGVENRVDWTIPQPKSKDVNNNSNNNNNSDKNNSDNNIQPGPLTAAVGPLKKIPLPPLFNQKICFALCLR